MYIFSFIRINYIKFNVLFLLFSKLLLNILVIFIGLCLILEIISYLNDKCPIKFKIYILPFLFEDLLEVSSILKRA